MVVKSYSTTEDAMTKRDATAAFIEHVTLIRAHLATVAAKLEERVDETRTPDWADVGDLAHVSSELADVVAFVNGEDR